MRKISDKMGLKANMRIIFVSMPANVQSEIALSSLDIKKKLMGKFDYIHFFAKTQDEFSNQFPKLINHLNETGMLWASWPKSGKLETDLNIKSVIKLGYDFGLVESKCISINDDWSALKFTWPKPGKVYANSYGSLKKQQ